jgi:chromosomal replication initiator protein
VWTPLWTADSYEEGNCLNEATQLWATCAETIREQVSDAVWQSTFNQVIVDLADEDEFVLTVPNLRIKESIEGRYHSIVQDAIIAATSEPVNLRIDVQTTESEPDRLLAPSGAEFEDLFVDTDSGTEENVSDATEDDRYTFDSFVIGDSNRFAHAAARAVAETPGRSYNPLFIYGDAGLGKTHLLQAIGRYVNEHYSHYTVRYISTEALLNEFVDAIRNRTQLTFKQRYRDVDVLLVDDIQFMEGKEALQEEFFHTFNTLYQAKRQIVLSSDRPPDSMKTLEDRLRSRFKMGLMTDIQPPDLETRLAILRKKAEMEAQPIPDGVLVFIASHITDNIREIEGALIRVTAYAQLTDEELTVDLAERILGDIMSNSQPEPITAALILDKTSAQFAIPIEDIIGASRRRPLVQARQVAMYVCRDLTDLSYPEIGRVFGNRDHTTVIHAVEKIGGLMSERRQIYDQVTQLFQTIRSGG